MTNNSKGSVKEIHILMVAAIVTVSLILFSGGVLLLDSRSDNMVTWKSRGLIREMKRLPGGEAIDKVTVSGSRAEPTSFTVTLKAGYEDMDGVEKLGQEIMGFFDEKLTAKTNLPINSFLLCFFILSQDNLLVDSDGKGKLKELFQAFREHNYKTDTYIWNLEEDFVFLQHPSYNRLEGHDSP